MGLVICFEVLSWNSEIWPHPPPLRQKCVISCLQAIRSFPFSCFQPSAVFICHLILLYCWSPLCHTHTHTHTHTPSSPPHPGRGRTLRRGVQGCITGCSILSTDNFGSSSVQFHIHSKRVTRRQRRLPPISHSQSFSTPCFFVPN